MKFWIGTTNQENIRVFDNQEYELINDEMLIGEVIEVPHKVYACWNNEKVKYITESPTEEIKHYESIKHPQNLTEDERWRVLKYCLATFDKDEIVNYNDLFLQGEFIKEVATELKLLEYVKSVYDALGNFNAHLEATLERTNIEISKDDNTTYINIIKRIKELSK